jgi:hypothetical protein
VADQPHTNQLTRLAALAAGLVSLGLPSSALAQVSDPTGVPASADIRLTGTVEASIMIQVDGSVDLTSNRPTVITGSGTQGFVNFGVYTGGPGGLLTGEKHKTTGPPANRGSYIVATLAARVILTGGAGPATVDIQRTNPAGTWPDVPVGHLYYAVPATRGKSQKYAWPKWDKYPEPRLGSSVFPMPLSTYVPGAGNLATDMNSGDSMDHQVAIWIPDSLTPTPFSTLVTYTGVAP